MKPEDLVITATSMQDHRGFAAISDRHAASSFTCFRPESWGVVWLIDAFPMHSLGASGKKESCLGNDAR